MIVNRRTFIAKPGQLQKAAEILKSGLVFVPYQPNYRIYISEIAPFSLVALEIEFKDLAEYELFWNGTTEKLTEDWWQVWFSVTDNGGQNEIWKLA